MTAVFSFDALHDALVRRLPEISTSDGVRVHFVDAGDDGRSADLLGVSRRQIQRWKHEGLSPAVADRAATRLGSHPAFIWREWDAVNDAIEGDDLRMLELEAAS